MHWALSIMKASKSEQRKFFYGILGLGVFFYVVDCFWASQEHPELPWLESGTHAGGLFGFLATAICIVCAFLFLIFGRDK
jgi:presenilin-like A22 family membrane protease